LLALSAGADVAAPCRWQGGGVLSRKVIAARPSGTPATMAAPAPVACATSRAAPGSAARAAPAPVVRARHRTTSIAETKR